jgi:hypothetical protein
MDKKMNELNHNFYLADSQQYMDSGKLMPIDSSNFGKIPHNLLWYIDDTLKWLPTFTPSGNPSTPNIFQGLNHYGLTIITTEGAVVLQDVCASWATLFSHCPETLMLRGYAELAEDNPNPIPQRYEVFTYPRDKIVKNLRIIAGISQEVVCSDGRLYLLHLGL